MQFSKSLLTFGTAALCLAAVSSRAADTADDLKLREALRQKLAEAGPETTAPAKTVTAPAAAPVVEAAPSSAPLTPVVAAPFEAQPAPAAIDDAQTERLREALRARLQLEAAPPTQPQQVVTQGSNVGTTVSTTQIVAPATSVQPVTQAPAKAPVTFEAPPSSIPASKEARLAALLQQYKADLISPQEYHEQRAKIIAE